jgi:rhodanese-related sulfurtransferase
MRDGLVFLLAAVTLMHTITTFGPAMRKYSCIALVLSILLASCTSSAQRFRINIAAFEKGIAQPDAQLLDVRTPDEYKSGHIKNALLADWQNSQDFDAKVKQLDKNKPVYTYCHSGRRSSAAAAHLRKEGFKEVYSLKGGIVAWKDADKPVE